MLLLSEARLDERRRLARDSELAALYQSLAGELEPLLGRELYIPDAKALLSRAGGLCESDGSALEFDPWSPHEHRCPRCGAVYRGELRHRAWVMPYQLWLAERAVHSALFFALRGEERHASLARAILEGYAERYLKYPNVDNVLGPTRLFFSTYLESIWLLQICVATDLLRACGVAEVHGNVAERIVEPSRRIIAEFDEGMSNRQVWNNAALLAAAALLGDEAAFEERLLRRGSGLNAHLSGALLKDATWYEGENYHQFALRGLWYGVTLAETRGASLDESLVLRFNRAFEVLYLTALPDFTMPSRKDSQYAVSLRQWRMAELAELGFARRQSSLLAGALARTYERGHPSADTGRSRSTADVERNGPATALSRADLGWKALLHASRELPEVEPRHAQSALLEEQGLAVFRRSPDIHVSFDYGRFGGGHGHPDRLNVTVAAGTERLLDDLGTGSYVDPSLHWYRSTLAHNAPLVNGRSQPESDGVLLAYDERGAMGWALSRVEWPERGVRVERAVIVAPEYVIDELTWIADREVRVELPWHLDGRADASLVPDSLDGGTGLEDGFEFVRAVFGADVRAHTPVGIRGTLRDRAFAAWLVGDQDGRLYQGHGPGQPVTRERPLYLMRAHGTRGRFRAVIAWTDVGAVQFDESGVALQLADCRHQHRRDENGWHVELFAMGARSSVDLAGFREVAQLAAKRPSIESAEIELGRKPIEFQLGDAHYRRSETTWRDAGSPGAVVALSASNATLTIGIRVQAANQRFAPAKAANPYDNEHADTMGAGVQLYLKTATGRAAWMLVPQRSGGVRARRITGWTDLAITPDARWKELRDGYEIVAELPLSFREFALDVLINEAPADRERRRGQIVLSGGEGEFVYLRGDRHDEERLLRFRAP